MIGYGANGYWMWDPVIKKVVLARSVIFDEHWQNREEKKTPYTLANNHIPSVNEKEIVVETKNTGMEQTRVNETRQSEDDQEQAIVIRSTRQKEVEGKEEKKARPVARGFLPLELDEVYAPVDRMMIIEILLSLAVQSDMHIHISTRL
ncbi:hypothetical protein QE152_g35262 [Popillia japonica]|uniref:Retroviral polymerase SH3-like domain-containing protein n=1 Tax=Popillia japonica TaxID=7064 RepID=A0AAW1IG13_POPJA